MAKLLLVACFASCSLFLSAAADKDVDSLLGESESNDDTCMMQVPDMKIRQVGTDKGNQEVRPARDAQHSDRVALLYTGLLRKTSQSYLPVTAALVVIWLLVVVYILHNCILAAFQNLPLISTLSYFGLLVVFCCSMLPVTWMSGADLIRECGTWTLIGSYIAILILMSTPIILLMPDVKTRQHLGHHWFDASEKVQTQRPAGGQQKIALLYLIIWAFQIISGMLIFQVARLVDEGPIEQNLPGRIMTTLLYVILSWYSLCVLYEHMFPQRSFAADFPSHVFQQAFIGSSKLSSRENHLQSRLDGMKDAITGLSTGPQPSEKQLRDFFKYMSSALADVYKDAMQQSVGITEEVKAMQAAIDDTAAGLLVNYAVWILYFAGTFLMSLSFGIKIAITIFKHAPFWSASLWLTVGFIAYMLLIVIVLEIIFHDAAFAGFSSGPAGVHQSTSAPADSMGSVFPGRRAASSAPASQEYPAASGADQGYLKNLVDLQKEMESKIGAHVGRSSTDVLATKADLASTLFKRGDFQGAAKLYREVWEARNRILGPQHPDTLNSKENLANALLSCGDTINAEKFYREVWETRARTLGPEHPDTRSTKYRLERCTSGVI